MADKKERKNKMKKLESRKVSVKIISVTVVLLLILGILTWAGIDAYKATSTSEPVPITMPEYYMISGSDLNDGDGYVEVQPVGNTFMWDGKWHADEETIGEISEEE